MFLSLILIASIIGTRVVRRYRVLLVSVAFLSVQYLILITVYHVSVYHSISGTSTSNFTNVPRSTGGGPGRRPRAAVGGRKSHGSCAVPLKKVFAVLY